MRLLSFLAPRYLLPSALVLLAGVLLIAADFQLDLPGLIQDVADVNMDGLVQRLGYALTTLLERGPSAAFNTQPFHLHARDIYPDSSTPDDVVVFDHAGDFMTLKWKRKASHQPSGLEAVEANGNSEEWTRDEARRRLTPLVRQWMEAQERAKAAAAHSGAGAGAVPERGRDGRPHRQRVLPTHHDGRGVGQHRRVRQRRRGFPPTVVHIAAHSSVTGVVMNGANQQLVEASTRWLASVFKQQATSRPGQVKLVVLFGCASRDVAAEIARYAPFVVGSWRERQRRGGARLRIGPVLPHCQEGLDQGGLQPSVSAGWRAEAERGLAVRARERRPHPGGPGAGHAVSGLGCTGCVHGEVIGCTWVTDCWCGEWC